jgi:hypothetical protein
MNSGWVGVQNDEVFGLSLCFFTLDFAQGQALRAKDCGDLFVEMRGNCRSLGGARDENLDLGAERC